MAQISITVPNADVADVLAGLESRWADEAKRFTPNYDSLTPQQRAKACIAASLRVYARNYRRGQAERAISVSEPDVT